MNYNECNIFKIDNYEINFYPIDKYIKENNLTEKEFCNKCKIPEIELIKIKSQDFNFSYNSLVKISIFTKISLDILIPNIFPTKFQTIFTL